MLEINTHSRGLLKAFKIFIWPSFSGTHTHKQVSVGLSSASGAAPSLSFRPGVHMGMTVYPRLKRFTSAKESNKESCSAICFRMAKEYIAWKVWKGQVVPSWSMEIIFAGINGWEHIKKHSFCAFSIILSCLMLLCLPYGLSRCV